MRNLILAASALAATLVAAAPAQAQSYDRYRDWRQEQRIHDGWRHGQISPREYYRLQREQARIDRYHWRSRHDDGRLSWRERERLAALRDRASRDIYRDRHDGRGYYGSYR